MLLVAIALITFSFLWRRVKFEGLTFVDCIHTAVRFRKRDKIKYYAVRFSRQFSAITEKLNNIKSPETRRRLIVAFVRRYCVWFINCLRVFNIPDELSATTLNRSRLPESFYEPDEDEDSSYPDDLKLMISSIRVFGHLEKSFFIEFCKFIETVTLNDGDFLFQVGDSDENVYVVRTGLIQMNVMEADGSRSTISEVTRGGSIDSFLSVLNVLSGNSSVHETLEARAVGPSVVLKLPIRSFLEICHPQTPALMRILQMVTIRLQRLTGVAVQSHLGLCTELIKQESVCNLMHSNALECLKCIQPADVVERQSSNSSAEEPEPPLVSVLANARGSICPLASDCVELNTHGEVVDEFEQGFEHNKGLLSPASRSKGLELGEVRSCTTKDKSSLSTASLPDASRLTPNESNSHPFDCSQLSDTLYGTPGPGGQPVDMQPSCLLKRGLFNPSGLDPESEASLMTAVEQDITQLLNLPDASLIHGHIVLTTVPSDTVLLEESDIHTELYYVLSGELHGTQSGFGSGLREVCTLFVCHSGDIVGLLGLITGESNVYSLKATKPSLLATLSRERFYTVAREHPDSLFSVIRLISVRVSPLLHQLDFAIQWITVTAGKALYKKGDPANYVYVVLSGRLRQVDSLSDGGHRVEGECGRGDMVGFLEVVCLQKRVHTVIAIRDSEVAQIPAFLLQHLKHKVPEVLNRIIRLLSGRLLGNITASNHGSIPSGLGLSPSRIPDPVEYDSKTDPTVRQLTKSTMSNLRTIAILPTTSSINAEAFALELQHSLSLIGSSVRLTSHIIRRRLGPAALASVNQYRLNAWLSHQEDLHRIVFFVCNYTRTSAWNRLCIRQADCVLVLALGNGNPSRPSAIEMTLKNHPTKVVKSLVLMYPLTTAYPTQRQTAKWLNLRPWISHHYHIRCEERVFTARNSDDLVAFYSDVFAHERPNPQSDFSRLARYLTGEAIGLVLGGGGARGCAHIGVIRALQEAGIPIDLIGGTSIGAFMSALWAEETRYAQFTQRARDYTKCFNSIWNKVKDFTYPAVSIFSGKEFNDKLQAVFGDRQVEDLWIPSFYVTTDITNCRMRVHTQGSLWRYVRASMSLSGYLPPLCDPYDGSLLLDGGYTNNVPAEIMSAFGAKTIFAVDVGATVDTDFTNYGDHLSGWQLLYQRFWPSTKAVMRVPNLSEIQARLAYISCVRQLEQIKESGICHYLRPPIDHYMTLQFTAFDEILTVGYEYAKQVIRDWHKEDLLRHLVPGLQPRVSFDQLSPPLSPARGQRTPSSDVAFSNSSWLTQAFDERHAFVDLAETVTAPLESSISTSGTDSEPGEYFHDGSAHGTRKSRNRSSLDRGLGLLASNPILFAKNQQDRVASLSRKIYSYLHSARHLVSQNFPNTGLFRRRALSDNLCAPSDSSILESSDDAGHFSDAQDYPGLEAHSVGIRLTSNYRIRSGSCDALGHQINTSNTLVTEHPQKHLVQPATQPNAPSAVDLKVKEAAQYPDDGGYLEDGESDSDPSHDPCTHPRLLASRSSDFVNYHSIEQACEPLDGNGESSDRRAIQRIHRLRRRSSLDRLRPCKQSPSPDSPTTQS
ncbi:lysophospholipid hydrolase [Paragonimus westermani]|uniref:Lysophospholipid hydrolase n=1 Tax=Paragonimus westermani TaxID=34504 RepID=A0A5J4NX42_9TREM|nr:lysophospholipid hydrolase [Paragonimus westermani]